MRRRDIRKTIEEYERMFPVRKDNHNKGAFYMSDFQQLWSISNTQYECTSNALMAGFMVGYKCAKREQRKKNASA